MCVLLVRAILLSIEWRHYFDSHYQRRDVSRAETRAGNRWSAVTGVHTFVGTIFMLRVCDSVKPVCLFVADYRKTSECNVTCEWPSCRRLAVWGLRLWLFDRRDLWFESRWEHEYCLFVFFVRCEDNGRGNQLITCAGEFYRVCVCLCVWCVCVCVVCLCLCVCVSVCVWVSVCVCGNLKCKPA